MHLVGSEPKVWWADRPHTQMGSSPKAVRSPDVIFYPSFVANAFSCVAVGIQKIFRDEKLRNHLIIA
jgi:hypothetical protein